MAEASLIVALIGFILIAGAFLKHSSQKRGYPLTLILLLLGIILGPITGIFTPGTAENQVAVTSFITLALILVLFDTGSQIKIKSLFRNFAGPTFFGILSVLFTIGIVAIPFKFLLGIDWTLALLFGSFLASTDLTILGPILSNIKLKPKVEQYLELESTLNTVVSAVLVIILVNLIKAPVAATTTIISESLKTLLYHIFVGAGLGVLFGFLILWSIRHMTLDELPHIIMIGALFTSFAITELLGASGIATALTIGMIFGNSKYKIPNIVSSFGGELEVILITFVYVILGAIMNFVILKSVVFLAAFLIVLIYLARYGALKISNKENPKYNRFYLISSPRGITCAVLTLSYAPLFPNPTAIIGLVFGVILFSSLSLFGITKTLPTRA